MRADHPAVVRVYRKQQQAALYVRARKMVKFVALPNRRGPECVCCWARRELLYISSPTIRRGASGRGREALIPY